jgi:hypothetical protein
MSGLATVVAVPLVALLMASLGSSGCKSFVSLPILFASSLPLLIACVAVFQPFRLLTDIAYECLGSNDLVANPSVR